MRRRRRRTVSPAALAAAFALALAGAARGQSTDDRLPGGSFELGLAVGVARFPDKSELETCRWNGVRFGHRFPAFSGNERLQLGFRVGIEGCLTEHARGGRIDLIHGNAAVLFGYRTSGSTILYWTSGAGELLGDSTPGPGDDVEPRFAWHGGPGFTWALSRRLLVDAQLMGIVFEGFELGPDPVPGSTFGFIPNLMLAIQI